MPLFILRRHRVTNFADNIRITTMFVKTIFKDPRNLKDLEIIFKVQSISVFLDIAKIVDFHEKMLISAELNRCRCVT